MEIVQSETRNELAITEEDDEFYEGIEAPKFVDFTVPDPSRPDDRSWFCVRVGCDQQHEEIDQGALYKSFVMRVMAARSPNVKLQKALNRHAPRLPKSSPRSAPAKSAKDRVSRMSTLTSVPDKLAKSRLMKDHPISSLRSSPKQKKTIVQPTISTTNKKALTTPRTKRCPTNHEPFWSMKYHKAPVKGPKSSSSRSVAKALFLPTTPEETATGTNSKKKLNIGSVKKHISGERLGKSFRCAACDPIHAETSLKKTEEYTLNSKQKETLPSSLDPTANESSKVGNNSTTQCNSKEVSEENPLVIVDDCHDSDENKENTSSYGTSNLSSSTGNSETESLKVETCENIPQKVIRVPSKIIQDHCAQGGKPKKTTNPKPFRLRTDERGILKEANLERRLKLAAHKETSSIIRQDEGNQQNGHAANGHDQQSAANIIQGPLANKKGAQESENNSVKIASSRQPSKAQSKAEKMRPVLRLRKKGAPAKDVQVENIAMANFICSKGRRRLATISKDSTCSRFRLQNSCKRRPEKAFS